MKPKKLNLQEITEIYYLLKPAIDKTNTDDTIGAIIYKIVDETESKALLECIHIMYDNSIEFSELDEFVSLFILALQENEFFDFVSFIKGMTDGSPKQ